MYVAVAFCDGVVMHTGWRMHLMPLFNTQDVEDDPSPYLDGFLRSFLLGLAMGGVFETLHVLIKVHLLLWWELR